MKDINKTIDELCGLTQEEEVKVASPKPDIQDLRKVASVLDTVAARMVEREPCALTKYANDYIGNVDSETKIYNDALEKLAANIFKRIGKKIGKRMISTDFANKSPIYRTIMPKGREVRRLERAERNAEKFQRSNMEASGASNELRMKGHTPEKKTRKELAQAYKNDSLGNFGSSKNFNKAKKKVKKVIEENPKTSAGVAGTGGYMAAKEKKKKNKKRNNGQQSFTITTGTN